MKNDVDGAADPTPPGANGANGTTPDGAPADTPGDGNQVDNNQDMTVSPTSGNTDAGDRAGANGTTPDGAPADTPGDGNQVDNGGNDDKGDTFPREYVERLRRENQGLRQRSVYADEMKGRLFRALVGNDGRLRDPDSLPYDEKLLDDPDARAAAISALLAEHPGLGKRHATGDIGAGARGHAAPPQVDLIAAIRQAQG